MKFFELVLTGNLKTQNGLRQAEVTITLTGKHICLPKATIKHEIP